MGAGKPGRVRTQTRVDRFLSSPQRVDVGMVGGEAGRHLGALGNGAVAGDKDIDVPGGLSNSVERRLVRAHLIGAARVEERDQDIGEHVAGEEDATVRKEDGGVADGVRLMLDDLARHGSAVRGQRGDERDQLERDVRCAFRRHRLRPLSGFTGSVRGGSGGVARDVAEPGMPEQVVPVGMGGEPGDYRNAESPQVIGELVQLGTIDARIDQDQPILPAHDDGIRPDPLTLPDPDAVGHFSQHRFHSTGDTHPFIVRLLTLFTEREGFEPSNEVNPRYAISSRARSTAPAPLQGSAAAREHYGTRSDGRRGACAEPDRPLVRFAPMVLAFSKAVSIDVGLIATFGGIGVIVNVIFIMIAIQVRGERRANREYRERLLER